MNKVILSGNLTKDMEVKATKNSLVGNFTIANNIGAGDNQKTTFVNCVVFGEWLENIEEYMITGCKVLVEGELAIENYENNNGEKKYATKIYVRSLEILTFKNDNNNNKKYKKGGRR